MCDDPSWEGWGAEADGQLRGMLIEPSENDNDHELRLNLIDDTLDQSMVHNQIFSGVGSFDDD
jgi:hypothetical protein